MRATCIETNPVPPLQREEYTFHTADGVCRELGDELEPLLIAHADGGPFTDEKLAGRCWIGRIDPVSDSVTGLVGMQPNGLLSPYLADIGGVCVWTEASWLGVSGLILRISWRTVWFEELGAPVSVVKPKVDIALWAPNQVDAQLCRALGNPV
jgi:hypothetical protein